MDSSPLVPPTPITTRSEIDLENGPRDQIQCRICLETDGKDFIAPCKCKGTSEFVHRECLDHWRSVKEGFAFAHCTTCKAPYHLSVHSEAGRKWRTLKFRFFVTRDILFVLFSVQLVISTVACLVYLIDVRWHFWFRPTWSYVEAISFYYVCGAVLFFAFMGLFGCCVTCTDSTLHSDPSQPCQEVFICHNYPGYGYISCPGGCDNCSGGDGQDGLHVLLILALIVVVLFAVFGIFYSMLVATMVGQRIWQRHYHILEKRMLTKEYIVEDIARADNEADWLPPALPPEHAQQLKALGLI